MHNPVEFKFTESTDNIIWLEIDPTITIFFEDFKSVEALYNVLRNAIEVHAEKSILDETIHSNNS